jgi:nucleotide-binding universal stress UspA family protein
VRQERTTMKARPTRHAGEIILEVKSGDELLLAPEKIPAAPTLKIKQILVPIDFSECSKKGLRYAIALAREHKAAITLAYVVPSISMLGEYGGIDYASLNKEMRESADRELATVAVDEIRGVVPSDTVVRAGSPAGEIVSIAKTLPADLIVISTHGRTGLKHALLGSVAERVVQTAMCPVLVVRESEREILPD